MSKLDKIEELQQLIKEDSSNFQARRQLAVLLMDCGFNEEALQHLLYLAKMFSYDDGIYYNLGIVYEKMKNFKKAKESYEKAIELEEMMPMYSIMNARSYKWDMSENKIKTVIAIAHTDLGVLKLSDVVKRLLSETD